MVPLSGSTRVAGVIGSPVQHSLSPAIMNAAFEATDLDWIFCAFRVAPGNGPAAVAAMRALDLAGLSVTMPHKAGVIDALDRTTPVAAVLGAVNCIAPDGAALVGHNTDGGGLLDSIAAETGTPVVGRRCVLIGAGGAGRAIANALGEAGAADIAVVNRDHGRATAAAELAGAAGRVGSARDVADADVVINSTSVGMAGTEAADALPVDSDLLGADQIVVDIVYHPLLTPLLREADRRGARAVSGIGMLVHQAARAFTLWTGIDAPVAAMTEAARAACDGGRS